MVSALSGELREQAAAAGLDGYVPKESAHEALVDSIIEVTSKKLGCEAASTFVGVRQRCGCRFFVTLQSSYIWVVLEATLRAVEHHNNQEPLNIYTLLEKFTPNGKPCTRGCMFSYDKPRAPSHRVRTQFNCSAHVLRIARYNGRFARPPPTANWACD